MEEYKMEKEECEELIKTVLENANEPLYIVEEKPLWLPAGSVRAVLSLGTVGTCLWMLSKGNIPVETFIAVAGVVFGFYFGSKK